ncbi:MAG TPA: glycosyltransferase, partial [Bacteroidia bacterium]|nr:glycosyltransferase [Bacteroidia bacterium]
VGDVPLFINDNNGKLIDSKNEEQLLRAMEEVFHNSSNYNPAKIRNMVLDKVSPAAISKQFTDIYRTVIGARSPVAGDKLQTPAKLKVLFISSWYPNRVRPLHGISIQRYAELLVPECDVSVVYICSDNKNGVEIKNINGIYTLIIYFKRIKTNIPPVSPLIKLLRYCMAWRKALKIHRKEKGKPDIINSNIVYPVSIIASLLKKAWGVPYVITECWSGYFPEDGRYKGFFKKTVSKIAVANASAVITPSFILAKTMRSLGLKNNYLTIPNVVDVEQFNIKLPAHPADTSFHFIHISSLTEEKNITGIIRAFKKIHSVHPQTKLTIIWDEEVKELLDKIKEPFSERDGIFLLGKKVGAELAGILQAADAFVLFSYFETQSIVLLEALCCGIPVIASRCRGPEEYITAKNGLLVDVNNEVQLAEAMEKMIKNRAMYNPVEIRNSVSDMVRKENIAGKLIETFKDVLKLN